MRHAIRDDNAAPGHDSFLDVVSNMVGILIILVMVTGLRVRNAAVEAATSNDFLETQLAQLQDRKATARSMRDDVLQATARAEQLEREKAIRQLQRDRLAMAVAAWEARIRLHGEQLDAEARKAYDLGLELAGARAELESLERDRRAAEAAESPPEVIHSYPTPLSKTVDQDEAHFQLRAGRIVFIPLEDLLDQVKQKAHRLLHRPELSDTVGPVGGFRLRFTLERYDVPIETAAATGKGGSYVRLGQWTLIPASSQLGETVDVALSEGSEFRRVLSRLRPGRSTITVWTYPDSFAEFRRLKEDLYHQGFAVAGRPLPHDVPIGGSPEGSKSSAQ
jgi:hypothetical protein